MSGHLDLGQGTERAHPDLNQGPADLQSAALATELCTHVAVSGYDLRQVLTQEQGRRDQPQRQGKCKTLGWARGAGGELLRAGAPYT